MVEGNVAEFSVATFNLRGVSDRYGERRKMLQLCIREEIDADVLCFQECLTGEYGQDRDLLGKSYHVFGCKAALFNLMESGNNILRMYARSVMNIMGFSPMLRLMLSLPEPVESFRERFHLQGSFFRTLRDLAIAPFFGNSIATRLVDLHEINHSTLVLGDWRAAQRIEFELREDEDVDGSEVGPKAVEQTTDAATPSDRPRFKIWIVNTHLDHEHADNRERQASRVMEWMESAREDCAAVVLCGDFNGNPSESFHQLLQSKGYRSGYGTRHGAEPLGTWPTGIEAPLKDEGPFECLDYVYVWAAEDFDLKIIDAQVFGDHPDPKDPTLYPSDHAAIKVTLRLEKKRSLEPVDEDELI
jgi:endonuclease/exonuclease/phosphatase family metal-dependent hydrolase